MATLGKWSDPIGAAGPGRQFQISCKFTADSSNAYLATPSPALNALMTGAQVIFDSVAAPNSLTFPINSPEGVARISSQTFTASGSIVLPALIVAFPTGFTIPAPTGNTNPGAIFTIVFDMIGG